MKVSTFMLIAMLVAFPNAGNALGGKLRVETSDLNNAVALRTDDWTGFKLEPLRPAIQIDGANPALTKIATAEDAGRLTLTCDFDGSAQLVLQFSAGPDDRLYIDATLKNSGNRPVVLNRVRLLGTVSDTGAAFGTTPAQVRVLEQGNYWGRVTPLLKEAQPEAQKPGEPMGAPQPAKHASDFVSVIYDRLGKKAFLAGFTSSERWAGLISLVEEKDRRFNWKLEFDGGDLVVDPGEVLALEQVMLAIAANPWRLLEDYAAAAAAKFPPTIPAEPPVSWCSWYPYRLSVTEDRVLDEARIARQRLYDLGLRYFVVDLGWQTGQLPSTFEENDQFSRGLKDLSLKLEDMGFKLGVWCAPFSISEFDPLVKEHPEWLIQDEAGRPAAHSDWYWEPHGKVYILDLTHPEAREYLARQMRSLYDRGVRYLKSDFIGCASSSLAKRRHDLRLVAGGGTEAPRIGARIIRESLPDALLLNCGGPEPPGTGQWPLLYACNDTGNTGFISAAAQQQNYLNLACHLYKNRRWGILQPSCLCVGMPGDVEDARLRATAAFLTGGQIDLGDTLTTLPENRWDILTATLPPLNVTAKPVDLFEPVYSPGEYGYSSVTSGGRQQEELREYPPGTVWWAHIKSDWDEWDLVAVFSYENTATDTEPQITRLRVPLSSVGLQSNNKYWAYEFWNRQFLGPVPDKRSNPNNYAHPGDIQDLAVADDPHHLDVAFFGPGVKLICLRDIKPHPWPVGSSFHQSCGMELKNVAWDEQTATLRGEIHRPAGETGLLLIASAGYQCIQAKIDGDPVPVRPAAKGAVTLPAVLRNRPAKWELQFAR